MKRILSLGVGVQSSTLFFLSIDKKIKEYDFILFADTHTEPEYVYEYLDYLRTFRDIITVSNGNLGDTKHNFIPAYFDGDNHIKAPLRRQCTEKYKIDPIKKYIKGLGEKVIVDIGISIDEIHRVKQSKNKFITNEFPLIDLEFDRLDCNNYLLETGRKIPHKSSCYFCPFHNDNYWIFLKTEFPDEFQKAIDYDNNLRLKKYNPTIDGRIFLHKSCKPVQDVIFKNEFQNKFEFSCSGYCNH